MNPPLLGQLHLCTGKPASSGLRALKVCSNTRHFCIDFEGRGVVTGSFDADAVIHDEAAVRCEAYRQQSHRQTLTHKTFEFAMRDDEPIRLQHACQKVEILVGGNLQSVKRLFF